MEAGAGPEGHGDAPDVGHALALDDVAELLVRMAVERRLARLDDADELGDVEAAGVLVDQVAERPLDGGGVLRLVVEADRLLPAGGGGPRGGGGRGGGRAEALPAPAVRPPRLPPVVRDAPARVPRAR